MSRLAATPNQVSRLLEALTPHGFMPKRVELAADGSIILHGEVAELAVDRDLLADWETKRASRLN